MNDDGQVARRFHEGTKHSPDSVRRGAHGLDWANQPMPWKIYEGALPQTPLPTEFAVLPAPALATLLGREGETGPSPLDRSAVARVLHHGLGVMRRRSLGGGREIAFRAAACTGALYHLDAYVVCGDLADLVAGVYHFDPRGAVLHALRRGDARGTLAAATAAAGGEVPPVAIVLASTYWRNAWKYRARAYRHVFWDGGTIVAHLFAEAAVLGVRARLDVGFVDGAVERLCGLDPEREGVAAVFWLGDEAPTPALRAEPALDLATKALSPHEIAYPAIPETHAGGALASAEDVSAWRGRAVAPAKPSPSSALVGLETDPSLSDEPLERVIRRRGSTREFDRRSISKTALANLLSAASEPVPADHRADPARALGELYVVVHAVDGVEPGAYRWHAKESGLEPIRLGEWRREAGFLALGQPLAADAAVDVYAIADLGAVLGALGTRGYRAATIDGAIAGGRLYLAAYAQRFGATGLTFFDDEVTRFFGLDPARHAVTFLTAIGHAARSPAR